MIRLSDINGDPYKIGVTSGPYGQGLLTDYPSTVQEYSRVMPESGLVSFEDKRFFEDKMVFTDPNFFTFFSYPLLEGDPKTVLSEQNHVVLSKRMAKKYFGDTDPIGQQIVVDNEYNFLVTGIMDELPSKSHLDFEMVFHIEVFDSYDWFHDWWNNSLGTYVKINTPDEAKYLDGQLESFMMKYFGDDFNRSGVKMGLETEPLASIYFNKDTRYDPAEHGNKNSVVILGIVGLIILFIACFNYINLSIAMAFKRAKEVGIRKVLGVERKRLVYQFLGESLLVVLIAIITAVGLSMVLKPIFNQLFGTQLTFDWADPNVIYFITGVFIGVLLSSGLYPAILLSSFNPLNILKSGKLPLGRNVFVRKGLVIAQFSFSIFLIIATLMISVQLNYLNTKNLGYDQTGILLIDNNNQEIRQKRDLFKKALRQLPEVISVSSASGEPGGFHDATVAQVVGTTSNARVRTVFADPHYLTTFGINKLAGRDFNEELVDEDGEAMMLNEKALQEIGLSANEVIGRKVVIPSFGLEKRIVGVFQDYHFQNLRTPIEAQAIMMGHYHRVYAVKINIQNLSSTLNKIEDIFSDFSPNYPISYEFQDDALARHYETETKQAKLFTLFSSISILLACMGIFGLAAYAAEQRQKELGIRKILGATFQQVILLISREFIILVSIASLIAIPLSWYFMESWLSDFAYRIQLINNVGIFILGGILTAAIAFVTISVKTFRAAVSNPTESIRYE